MLNLHSSLVAGAWLCLRRFLQGSLHSANKYCLYALVGTSVLATVGL